MNKNAFFMLFVFVIGMILFIKGWTIYSLLNDECSDITSLKTSLQGVITLSTVLVVFSISYFLCRWKCNCDSSSEGGNDLIYNSFSILLGIVLIVLGAIIDNKSDRCVKVQQESKTIWVLGIVLTVVSSGYLAYKYKHKMFKSK